MRSLNTLLLIGLLSNGSSEIGCTAEPILPRGADEWRYSESAVAAGNDQLPTSWHTPDFDDSNWPVGKASLGYGDPDLATEVMRPDALRQGCHAVLFRRRFRLENVARFRLVRGRVCCDDGAVVYVNGREVYRYNMPAGELTLDSNAVRAVGPDRESERAMHAFSVNPSDVVSGENVVAVSVHQANGTSSDLALDLELTGLNSDEEVAAFRQELEAEAVSDEQVRPASLKLKPVSRLQIMADRRD